MHDRAVIIRTDVVAISDALIELRPVGCSDVRVVNRHEAVAIFATLLMPQSDDMPNFVDDVPGGARRVQVDKLLTAYHPYS